jgi:cytoplasmic iron level regulating protein YaaA (DUF328/UPF0246 family)
MADPPLILLPPSEGKAVGGTGGPVEAGSLSFPDLDPHRARALAAVIRAMRTSGSRRSKLLGVKGMALAAATATNLEVSTSPTMPAIERYTGVLYDALDAATLSSRDRKRLDRQVIILSGLFGLVRPTDEIPDYKLKMGATLPPMGKLSTWWRGPITQSLAPVVANATVWNLLPNEHTSAWVPPRMGSGEPGAPSSILSVKFLDETPRSTHAERSFTTVNHWNKLLKGALVRFIVATGADEPAALASFSHPQGYRFDPSLTSTTDAGTIIAMVRPRP